ncbi:response regulator [Flammeovirga sp. MY04]|uniref:hybrid sensor histidine kinase/response regulator n=1 Tax=Flammeovirga sp. MY04 TaxID=1191459 RepID=UPI0008064234|nr:response regulator [Flammeovirga sp. MY04]ANQ51640.1 response regulator [Flammeovirga sp. MY04]
MEQQINNRRETKFFLLASTLTIIAFAFFGWELNKAYKDFQRESDIIWKVAQLQKDIIFCDEVLTTSTKIAALTSEKKWEEKYKRYEAVLDNAIVKALEMDTKGEFEALLKGTEAANKKLIDIESKFFQLIRDGKAEEASQLLNSRAYLDNKVRYADTMEDFSEKLGGRIDEVFEEKSQRIKIDLIGVALSIIAAIFAWYLVFINNRRLHSRLSEQNKKLNEKLEEVEELNANLDQKVEDRTRELGIFRRFADSSSNGLGMADMRDQSIVYVNESLQHLLDEDHVDAVYKKTVQGYYTPESQKKLEEEMLPSVMSTGAWSGELEMLTAKNRRLSTYENYFLVKNEKGEPIYLADIIIDITQRRKAEEQLKSAKEIAEEAANAKSMFLANMSHEIRTPMNAIMGLTNLVLDTQLDERQKSFLKKIQLSSQSLLSIVNDVLDFSKIEAGKVDIENVYFNLQDDVLENIMNVIGFRAKEKGITVKFDISSQIPKLLKGDPLRISQIILNLMNNAVKFTPKGQVTLKIGLDETKGHTKLHIEVIDTGIGLTEDQRSRLFQEFNQADTSTTRKFGGTGLGLAISKKLATLMNGEIGVESQIDEGSNFWFTAEVEKVAEDSIAGKQPYKVRSLIGSTVLVVDDNEESLVILQNYLHNFGCKVHVVKSGEEALANITQSDITYDFILMDWKMPGMDGIETTRKIRELSKIHATTDILMVTAHDKEELSDKIDEESISGIIVKPVDEQELLDTLLSRFGFAANNEYKKSQNFPEHVKGAKILLVEDNEINQLIASELLAKFGVYVDIAENGQVGIEKVNKAFDDNEPYEGVLMDIQMPVMDGYTATEELRKDARYTELPIIAMTANALSQDKDRAREAGMTDHIAKPIDNAQLFSILGRWIEAKGNYKSNDPKLLEKLKEAGKDIDAKSDIQIEGIDTEIAIKRCGGNEELFLSVLDKFFNKQQDTLVRLMELSTDKDYTELEKEAHTVKGVSANLGMTEVSKAAERLESSLKYYETYDEVAYNDLLVQLSIMLENIRQFKGEEETQESPQETDTPTEIVSINDFPDEKAQLLQLLDEGDPEAGEIIKSLLEKVTIEEEKNGLKAALEFVQEYDFEEGCKALGNL